MLRAPLSARLGAGVGPSTRPRCRLEALAVSARSSSKRVALRRVAVAARLGESAQNGGSQPAPAEQVPETQTLVDAGVVQALQERVSQAEVLLMRKELEEREQTLRYKTIVEELQKRVERARAEVETQAGKLAQQELEVSKKVESQMAKLVRKAEAEGRESSKKEVDKLKAKLKDAEETLKQNLKVSQQELADAQKSAALDAEAKVNAKLEEARTAIAAAEARAAAAEAQLRSQTALFEQVDASMKAKQAAEALATTLDKERAAQEGEANNLRQIAAASAEKMMESQARAKAAEESVKERVQSTLEAAENCVQAAEVVKTETEKAAGAAAEVAKAEVQAAKLRAEAAEAKLVRQEELLNRVAETTAKKEAAETALVEAVQMSHALKAEVQLLRDAQGSAEQRAAAAVARADAAEAAVQKATEKQLAAADERVGAAEKKLSFVEETLAKQQEAAETEVKALKEALKAARVTQEVETAAAKRLITGMERVMATAEQKAAEWEAKAVEAETALAFLTRSLESAGIEVDFRGAVISEQPQQGASGSGAAAAAEAGQISPPWSRRLSGLLRGREVRALMAGGPRAHVDELHHLESYREIVQAEHEEERRKAGWAPQKAQGQGVAGAPGTPIPAPAVAPQTLGAMPKK